MNPSKRVESDERNIKKTAPKIARMTIIILVFILVFVFLWAIQTNEVEEPTPYECIQWEPEPYMHASANNTTHMIYNATLTQECLEDIQEECTSIHVQFQLQWDESNIVSNFTVLYTTENLGTSISQELYFKSHLGTPDRVIPIGGRCFR